MFKTQTISSISQINQLAIENYAVQNSLKHLIENYAWFWAAVQNAFTEMSQGTLLNREFNLWQWIIVTAFFAMYTTVSQCTE